MLFSFEFFPPKTPAQKRRLGDTIASLQHWQPTFVSVTCGAGGSSKDDGSSHDSTLITISDIVDRCPDMPVAMHLTCIGSEHEDIADTSRRARKLGVEHIVALRGDIPQWSSREEALPGYQNAGELVRGLREQGRQEGYRWEISVAAYPETHHEALSRQDDLLNLRRKVESGADRVLTQFFFRNEDFYRLRDDAVALGVDVPIVPGIFPIRDFRRTVDFAGRCGVSVPDEVTRLFDDIEEPPPSTAKSSDPADIARREQAKNTARNIAIDFAVRQCSELHEQGVKAFHFFTLNQADLVEEVCRQLVST